MNSPLPGEEEWVGFQATREGFLLCKKSWNLIDKIIVNQAGPKRRNESVEMKYYLSAEKGKRRNDESAEKIKISPIIFVLSFKKSWNFFITVSAHYISAAFYKLLFMLPVSCST